MEKTTIARDFLSKSVCCLPVGLAQGLRRRGFTEEFLLNDSGLHHALYYLAKCTSLTIADVEWRHARHRSRAHSSGQSRLSSFSASSVNAEARVLHAARTSSIRPPAAQVEAAPVEVIPIADAAAGQPRKQYVRAQTGRQLHRIDVIKRHKQAGCKVNVCTREFWNECRLEYEQLPEAVRNNYEQQASSSVDLARLARSAKRRRQQDVDLAAQQPWAGQTQALALACPCCCAPVAGHCPQLHRMHLNVEVPLQQPAQQAQTDLLKMFAPENTPEAPQEFPVSPALLEQFRKNRNKPMAAIASDFKTTVNRIEAASGFPSKVTYSRSCGAYCKIESPPEKLQFCKKFEEALCTVASRHGPVADLSRLGIVLCVEVFTILSADAVECMFFQCACAAAQSAHHPPWQEFCRLQPVAAEHTAIVGTELEVMLKPFVPPCKPPRAPLRDATKGAPVLLSNDELANLLYSSFDAGEGKVKITELLYRDVSLSRIAITGVDPKFQPLCVLTMAAEALDVPPIGDAPADRGGRGLNVDFSKVFDKPKQRRAPSCRSRSAGVLVQEDFVQDLCEELGVELDDVLDSPAGTSLEGNLLLALPDAGRAQVAGMLEALAEVDGADDELEEGEEDAAEQHETDEVEQEEQLAEQHAAAPVGSNAELGVVEVGKWNFKTPSGVDLGNLRRIRALNLKALCRRHKSCVCWVTCRASAEEATLEKDLVKWLAVGATVSANEHAASAHNIKVQYGMRPRARPA